jgi:hypothetical protein
MAIIIVLQMPVQLTVSFAFDIALAAGLQWPAYDVKLAIADPCPNFCRLTHSWNIQKLFGDSLAFCPICLPRSSDKVLKMGSG